MEKNEMKPGDLNASLKDDRVARFEGKEAMAHQSEYGMAVRAFFSEKGLTLLGGGERFLGLASQGWSKRSRWTAEKIIALADGLRLARAVLASEMNAPGKMKGLQDESFLNAPIALTEADLRELDDGAWAKALEKTASESVKEWALWGLERRKSSIFVASDSSWGGSVLQEVWANWIKEKGWQWLDERVLLSINALDELAGSDLVKKDGGSAQRNCRWLAARLGRPEHEGDFVARLATMFSMSHSHGWGVGDWFFRAHIQDDSSFEFVVGELAETLGFQHSSSEAAAPWRSDSVWTQSGILCPVAGEVEFGGAGSYHRVPAGFYLDLGRRVMFKLSLDLIENSWQSEADLMANFYSPFEGGEGLSPDDWSHVGDELGDILAALSRGKVKVLLWGEPGTGKSSLAGAIARAARLTAVAPAALDKSENNSQMGDLGLSRLEAVMAAERLARAVERPLMVVDECEPILTDDSHKIDTTQALEAKGCSQIWIANSLNKAHEAFLRRFDFILRVPAMPIASRERLARQLFGEGALAGRLAQSMRNPAELVAAKRWCEAAGEESWAVVSRKMAGHQRAVSAAHGDKHGNFEVIPPGSSALSLDDFAGNERMRREIKTISGLFADPARYAKLGAKIPKGYLLEGGPGSGKTWFARVLSAVAGVPMVVANGAALASHPERFAELFAEARKRAPCVVFVDEFDVVGTSARRSDGSLDLERQKILNQFLVELDGFDPLEGVLLLAATHNGSSVDKAVTRAGRLGRTLSFGEPGPLERPSVWQAHLKSEIASPEVDWQRLSDSSRGFSYAEIAEAAERAKMEEASRGADQVGMSALEAACDDVFWGEEAQSYMTEAERWRTAVHEAGHALAALRGGLRAQRATIRPRSNFLGAVAVLGEEGALSRGPSEIDTRLRVNLAGYAAEKAVFGAPSDGASSDLASARKTATQALQDLALGREPQAGQGSVAMGLAISQHSLMELENLGREKLKEAMAYCDELFKSERAALEALARELLEKRDLSRSEIEAAVNAASSYQQNRSERGELALAASVTKGVD